MKYWFTYILLLLLPLSSFASVQGIGVDVLYNDTLIAKQDSVIAGSDVNIETSDNDTIAFQYSDGNLVVPDSVADGKEAKPKVPKVWMPDSNRAVWLATLFPGAGQIYNKKYWKLPIFYGGFVACTYALTWNNRMYKDYSQAYLDIMDSDPRTNSFVDFLPPNYDTSNEAILNQLKSTFKNKKDYYRKYRDLSIFAFIGVYVISIIDAYVDAELSTFDISPDLSMGINPAILNDESSRRNAYGLQYRLTF